MHRSRLVRVGLEDQIPRLQKTALAQATKARDDAGHGRVAASLGPLLASYRPDLKPDPETAKTLFGELVEAMDPMADLFLIETVSSVLEAEGALLGTAGTKKPVWLALSVADTDGTLLRSGESLVAVAPLVQRFAPDAVLIYCSCPEAIPAALDIIKRFGRPYGAYANGFTEISQAFLHDAPTVDALDRRTDMGPVAYAGHVMGWIAQGATIVGGCCEIGPDHIAEIAHHLRQPGHQIV